MISPLVYSTIVSCLLGAHATTIYFMGRHIRALRDALTMRDVLLGDERKRLSGNTVGHFSVGSGDTLKLTFKTNVTGIELLFSNATSVHYAVQ